jgi:hypothetical protein
MRCRVSWEAPIYCGECTRLERPRKRRKRMNVIKVALLVLAAVAGCTGLVVEMQSYEARSKRLVVVVACEIVLVRALPGSRLTGAILNGPGEAVLIDVGAGDTRVTTAGGAHLVLSFEVDDRLWRAHAEDMWLECGEEAATFPQLTCRIELARNASCFAAPDGRARAVHAGGVPPVNAVWGRAMNVERMRGGDELELAVWDALGRACVATKTAMPPLAPLSGVVAVKHVSCAGGRDGIMDLSVTGGKPPYRYRWSGGGSTDEDVMGTAGVYTVQITDAAGCMAEAVATVTEPQPLVVELVAEGSSLEARVHGGCPPYTLHWSSGETGETTRLSNVLPGFHRVVVVDAGTCRRNGSAVVLCQEDCTSLNTCLDGCSDAMRNLCLRQLGAPMLWNDKHWSCAATLAVISVLRELRLDAMEKDAGDLGAAYLAVLLGELIASGKSCFGASVEATLLPLLPACVVELYREASSYADFQKAAIAWIALGKGFGLAWEKNVTKPVILTVGPFGFDNEPVFAPNLVLPTHVSSAVALVLEAFVFPTSSLTLAVFPWSLQLDVAWAALYVRDVGRLVGARWVLPADSGGILTIAKLASELYINDRSHPLVPALQRSAPWPPSYPPPHLSKLVPGHEAFAPREFVVSDSDSLHVSHIDNTVVAEALDAVGQFGFAKREFSEASRGVAKDLCGTFECAMQAVNSVFPRALGISSFDYELRVAIFMQQNVAMQSGVLPVAVRFFAHAGQVIAGHTSVAVESNIVYQTIRDEAAEAATFGFVRAINFTGFGAAWWWKDAARENLPLLIDFNARLERQACLTPVLAPRDLISCPCHALQTGLLEDELYLSSGPHLSRAGVRFMDPTRAMGTPPDEVLRFLGERQQHTAQWNTQRGDVALYSLIRERARVAVARAEAARRDA